MRSFTQLFTRLDETTRTTEKVAALRDYFRSAPPADAAWALHFLSGRKGRRAINTRLLREWLAERANLPLWLVEASYESVGDLAETIALLLPPPHPHSLEGEAPTSRVPIVSAAPTAPARGPLALQNQQETESDSANGWQLAKPDLPTGGNPAPTRTDEDIGAPTPLPLHQLVEEHLLPLRDLDEPERKLALFAMWDRLATAERFVWNKLITGGFRVGVARTLVARGLAEAFDLPPAVVAHRLMGDWQPTAETFQRLTRPETAPGENQSDDQREDASPGTPYPFYLASPLDAAPPTADSLGPPGEWFAEWKWDGIRAQLIRRQGQTLLWSRGEELMTDRFPEISGLIPVPETDDAPLELPDGTVLDGEILAWDFHADSPRSFGDLQTRIGRKKPGKKTLAKTPCAFMAYDLLEINGADLRDSPHAERRRQLQALADATPGLRLSPLVDFESWDDLIALRGTSRERLVEGLMLKRRSAPYRVGRKKGDWWKWKVDPFSIDAVLTYAQKGHGRRSSLYTAYTFGLWHDGKLVTVAKAYSGLTDKEIRAVDKIIRKTKGQKFGPVVEVAPTLVFELHFEGIRRSPRHKSGVAVRFPRIHRWRQDKQPADADQLETLTGFLPDSGQP